MTEEELNIWFWDKYNSCYPVKCDDYPSSVYMFYDTNYIRSKKLANILGKEVEYPAIVNGDCLFEICHNLKFFYIHCDVIDFIKENNNTLKSTKEMIRSWMSEQILLRHFTIQFFGGYLKEFLDDKTKLKVLK